MLVAHIVEGEQWAGTEVSVINLLHALKSEGDLHLFCIALERGRLGDELVRMDIPVYTIARAHKLDCTVIDKISKLLRAQKVEVVHTHGYLAQIIGGLSAWLARLPLVTTVHGCPEPFGGFSGLKMQIYRALDLLAMKHLSNRVIAVSRDLKRALVKKGVDKRRLRTVYNAIDLGNCRISSGAFKTRANYGLSQGGFLVGTVGRLSPVKCQIYFLKAAQEVLAKREDVCFVIAGDGPMEAVLRRYVEENRLSGKVFFAGFVQDVVGLVSLMDVFVLTSLHEGIPMALLEAMALGKPVVVTSVGGLVEVVEDGVTGLLVSPLDEKAMAGAILRLLEQRDEAARLGRKAQILASSRFSASRMANQVLEVYREVVVIGGRR